MSKSKDFKIIIAGGGIAGLTLANTLEKFNIDYIILEAYKDIAPPVGASIGLFPNGLLVLDQLGCYEAVRAVSQAGEIDKAYVRDGQGHPLACTPHMFAQLEKRHGYPLLFFDRQWLLQVLYDQIQHKERVLLNKRVEKIDCGERGVQVTTQDGHVYNGDMVIGADGIHSAVRREMFRIAGEVQPGYFQHDEEEKVPAYYQCSFGIAQNVEGWNPSEQTLTTGHGTSFLVASGPENRVYWFLFVKLPEIKYGKDIPKYTKEDEALLVKEYQSLKITDKVTFGQVYAKRITSTLTPLHEVVYKKWFFQRIALIGDSAHKPNPIGGQGGNGAIESVAEFINALLEKRDSRAEGLHRLSTDDVAAVYKQMQSARYERASSAISGSHDMQSLFARENTVLAKLIWDVITPLAGDEATFQRIGDRVTGGARIKQLPVPQKPRVIPYDHERPAAPVASWKAKSVQIAFVAAMMFVLFISRKAFRLPFEEIGGWGELGPLDRNWLGNNMANNGLRLITSVITYPILDADPTARVHLIYFLTQLISPLFIYTVEGHRIGNQGTLLSLPVLYLAGMQVQGIGRIAPLYAALSALFGFEGPAGRKVNPVIAKVIVPALTLGYIIPTIMMFTPTVNTKSWQNWTALWQFAPPLVSAFTTLLASVLKHWQLRNRSADSKTQEDESPFERYKDDDVPILKSAYDHAFAVQATVHLATLAYAFSHPGVSLWNLFFDLPSPFSYNWALATLPAKIAVFFKYDMVLALGGIVAHNLYSIWDLRRSGYITTQKAAKAALYVLLGQLFVGHGAVWAKLWSWRETVISGLSTLK